MNLDFTDEGLRNILNRIISGLLPHENYEPENFNKVFTSLQRIITKNDCSGLYYIFFDILEKYNSLCVTDNYTVKLTTKKFENSIYNNAYDLILNPYVDINGILAEDNEIIDIRSEQDQAKAVNALYIKSMHLYDVCFKLSTKTSEVYSLFIELKDIMQNNLIYSSIRLQESIISTGVKLRGRQYYGAEGWLTLTSNSMRDIRRLTERDTSMLVCDNIDKLIVIEQEAQQAFEPLCNYGIPQIDDETPILKQRLVVLVARENTGKTKVMTDLVVKLILSGNKPYVATGETSKSNFLAQVVSNYLYRKYGLTIETKEVFSNDLSNFNLDIQQIIQTAKVEIMTSGLVIDDSLTYDAVPNTLREQARNGCNAFFIDHTQSLAGRNGRPMNEVVTNLALDCREFKNDTKSFVCLLSHPSSDMKDLLQTHPTSAKDAQISATAQSSVVSQEADEIFILYETDDLKSKNLLGWITYKRRGPKIPILYIQKVFHVSAFEYNEEDQAGEQTINASDIDSIIGMYGDSNDEYDEFEEIEESDEI